MSLLYIMALIVLKNRELIVGYGPNVTGTSMPQAYEFEDLDVIAYGEYNFAHIICDAQFSDTNHTLSHARIMSIIDIYDRVPIADGQYIHCARDYFDKFDLAQNYVGAPGARWSEVPGPVREIIAETSEQTCAVCDNLDRWKLRAIESGDYICAGCVKQYNHDTAFDLCERDLPHFQPCWIWFIKQVLRWRDVRLVVTNIDIQVILLVGDDYYVSVAPVPPIAIDAIIGSRKRLRFARDYHRYMRDPSPNAGKKMIREMFRDCEIPEELCAH